jgi:hypothetical protein
MPAALPPSAVQQFIVDGLHVIQPAELSLGDSFHRAVVDQADAAVAAGHGLGGNHHFLRVPLLRELLRDPAVDGALSSLFGEGWQLFQHSALHDGGRLQEATEQVLHKDGPMFGQPRYHRPRWGLLLYYPQPVDAEMGPTKVLPGSQYLFQTYGNPDPGVALPPVHNLTASAAGTVVITSYELSTAPQRTARTATARCTSCSSSARRSPARSPAVLRLLRLWRRSGNRRASD